MIFSKRKEWWNKWSLLNWIPLSKIQEPICSRLRSLKKIGSQAFAELNLNLPFLRVKSQCNRVFYFLNAFLCLNFFAVPIFVLSASECQEAECWTCSQPFAWSSSFPCKFLRFHDWFQFRWKSSKIPVFDDGVHELSQMQKNLPGTVNFSQLPL